MRSINRKGQRNCSECHRDYQRVFRLRKKQIEIY